MVDTFQGTPSRAHQLQLYATDAFLGAAVARFVADGLTAGESAVVVSTAAHWTLVRRGVEASGHDVRGALSAGRLRFVDADETLPRIARDGAVRRADFDEALRGVLADARGAGPAARVRLFGEMVDLLWERGAFDQADALEGFWNRALHERPYLTLFCSYRADPFGASLPTHALSAALAAHDSVEVEDRAGAAARFDAAVDEILGPSQAAMLRVVVAAAYPRESYAKAPAEYRMLWLRAHMPRIAERVLDRMRAPAQPA